MRRPTFRWITFVLVTVTACGGPGGPAGPVAPDATAVQPTVVARGGSIVVTGTGFGATPGTLAIGGVTATVTQWTDMAISATIPDDAPNAWQDVEITTPGGSDTLGGLFVGSEYTGDAASLQTYLDEQPVGSAVLLQARTYDLPAQPVRFEVDNIDLYGLGADQTTITLPTNARLYVLADFGTTTTIADVTLEGADVLLRHGTLRGAGRRVTSIVSPQPPGGSPTVDASALTATSSDERAGEADAFAVEAPPTVVFDGVHVELSSTGSWSPWNNASLALVITGSTIDMPASSVDLSALRGVTVERSEVTAAYLAIISTFSTVSVEGSTLVSRSGTSLGAEAGLSVTDSTVRAIDGNVSIHGAAAAGYGGSTVPGGGPVEISGSTIEALDAAPSQVNPVGILHIETTHAPILLTDNHLVRSHGDLVITTSESDFEGAITLTGNLDVRAGIFADEAAGTTRVADVYVRPESVGSMSRVTLTDNTITVTGDLFASGSASAVEVYASRNTITVGSEFVPGSALFGGAIADVVELTDNVLTVSASVTVAGNFGETVVVSGNTITNEHSFDGGVHIGADGSCVVTDNVVVLVDDSEVPHKHFYVGCASQREDRNALVANNQVSATGAGTNAIGLALEVLGDVIVNSNRFEGSTFRLHTDGSTTSFTGNTVVTGGDGLRFLGTSPNVTIADNTVTQHTPTTSGLNVGGFPGRVDVSGNTFTGTGTPAADAIALHVWLGTSPLTFTATENTFTNYSRALWFVDSTNDPVSLDATINHNVFDFTIDAPPKVALLTSIKDVIDARHNQWGHNTDLATVEGYWWLEGVGSGSILLDPITQP